MRAIPISDSQRVPAPPFVGGARGGDGGGSRQRSQLHLLHANWPRIPTRAKLERPSSRLSSVSRERLQSRGGGPLHSSSRSRTSFRPVDFPTCTRYSIASARSHSSDSIDFTRHERSPPALEVGATRQQVQPRGVAAATPDCNKSASPALLRTSKFQLFTHELF